ncbi:NAD(+) diphosphatase [uncultured Tissierella sp.]|uniref:NAD(+) diphosphatase n=1 Tax=uncultured Tissierella sp. TaxID=448160 RepID=UPI002803CC4F|nr:NAD(+) diphosphatase [uncultured Tissierella sp.]MDU5081746.1 NAD(+) diphosphatase [Bacillota bacterium]
MERYIKFEPSKQPLYDEYNKDYMYLFNEDRLMVEVKDGEYTIPNREGLERFKPHINYLQCLGAYNGINCYCGEIEELTADNYKFIDLRAYSKNISHDDFLISAKALLLLDYVRTNQRCGICGSKMIMKVSGNDRAMICTNCDHMVWPKTAPAIIVAITKEDKLLLAHNKMFPEGMYSILAGFVEMGETFEDCVKREVFEETGIKVHNIKYFGSQPWPFPNSMMIGFTAEYLEGEIKVDNDEIVDAKWFSKEEMPGKYRKSISISTELIEWFLNR